MAQKTELQVTRREMMGKAAKRLRKQGIIPANIFGHKQESEAVQVDAKVFDGLRRSHSAAGMITLKMDNAPAQTALIRHVQHDPRSGKVIHIDFYRVSLEEKLHVKVALRFIGEPAGVKDEGGVLLHLLDTLEVECQAQSIPEYLEVDIMPLTEIDSIIYAEEVKLPPNFTLLTDPKEGIVKVAAPRVEAAEPVDETVAMTPEGETPAAGAGTEGEA
ncbi:MAG: 50S ribosomal protein L25 [Chloroflexota bacterium]|nr:50S ribosomal protein L25 [Chloroflexota bacterium]